MACSIKNAPPTEAAVNKLLSKVGGTLEQALNSQELKWSSKRLDADDAHVVAYVVGERRGSFVLFCVLNRSS